MRTAWTGVAALALAAAAACGGTADEAPIAEDGSRQYAAFADVDTHTDAYFIELEGSGLAESQGEERLYNLGVNVCQRLDDGQTVAEQLADDAGLGDAIGSVVGAAVTDICPHHGEAVEDHLSSQP